MNKTRMAYFEKDDVLHFAISDEPEAGSVEVSPNITAELNTKGELIGLFFLLSPPSRKPQESRSRLDPFDYIPADWKNYELFWRHNRIFSWLA